LGSTSEQIAIIYTGDFADHSFCAGDAGEAGKDKDEQGEQGTDMFSVH